MEQSKESPWGPDLPLIPLHQVCLMRMDSAGHAATGRHAADTHLPGLVQPPPALRSELPISKTPTLCEKRELWLGPPHAWVLSRFPLAACDFVKLLPSVNVSFLDYRRRDLNWIQL